MFLFRVCVGTCFKENIWLFVDSYSNPHWHRAPPHRLSQLSQYLNILDLGPSPDSRVVQCCWCCWLVLLGEWVVSTAGYGKLTQCCCSELSSESRPGALSCGWVVTQWTSPHRSIVKCLSHLESGVSALCQWPLVTSDHTQRLGRDIEI